MNTREEIKSSRYLSGGLALVTLFVYTAEVSDPVNAPKFFIMGMVAFGASAIFIFPNLKFLWGRHKLIIFVALFIVCSTAVAVSASNSPFSQNLYGIYGRNTGLLTQLALLLILFSVLTIKNRESITILFFGFLGAGVLNIFYCLWVLFFGDFIGWVNPYKSLLGTLGNPNFISSLLGLTATGLLGFSIFNKQRVRAHLIVSGVCLIEVLEILKTNSSQGLVVFVLGIYLIMFFVILQKTKRIWVITTYANLGIVGAIFGVLAFLNKGPLSNLIYQETLGFRLQYWKAGINMGVMFPLTGVGLDGYGDWYRQLRTVESITSPGVGVITNVAHNVFIDSLASGGIPLFIGNLAITLLTLRCIIKVMRTPSKFDSLFVALSTTWACYQVQSIISINQIGLAIWGWAFSGMVMAYELISRDSTEESQTPKSEKKNYQGSQTLLRPIYLLIATSIGFLLFAPPIFADHKWTSTYADGNAEKLYLTLESSYFNPSNSFKYAQAIQIFENNNLPEQAHQLALKAAFFNPRSFEAWQLLYSLRNSSTSEREKALQKMIELDPLNDSLKALGR